MTKAEKVAYARQTFICRKMNSHPMGFREPMKGIHEERLELADKFPEGE